MQRSMLLVDAGGDVCNNGGVNMCKNDGVCVKATDQVTGQSLSSCTCPAGTSGVLCESRGICDLRCRNGGSCRHREEIKRDGSGTKMGFACECSGPYKGDDCAVPFATCPTTGGGDQCLWGGECVPDAGATEFSSGFECRCPFGRAGKSCQNGGGVVPEEHFDGDHDGVTHRACDGDGDCRNGGLCILSHDLQATAQTGVATRRAQCLCPLGWGGDACELPCGMLACQHGASCRFAAADGAGVGDGPVHGSYYCDCDRDRFRGPECEVAVARCPGPGGAECLHGGTCVRDGDRWGCSCPPGTTGDRCETRNAAVQVLAVPGGGMDPTVFVVVVLAAALFVFLPATVMIVKRGKQREVEMRMFAAEGSDSKGTERESAEKGSGDGAGQVTEEGQFA